MAAAAPLLNISSPADRPSVGVQVQRQVLSDGYFGPLEDQIADLDATLQRLESRRNQEQPPMPPGRFVIA